MMATTLHRRRSIANLTLREALAAASPAFGTTAIGVAATTSWYGFVRLTGAGLAAGPTKPDLNLEDVFDLRVFDEHIELRWLHRIGGTGPAVLLTEDDTLLDRVDARFGHDAAPTPPIVDTYPQTLLLWGTHTAPSGQDGWVRLSEARIGSMDAPYNGPIPDLSTHDLVLQLREYVAVADDGNTYVLSDRLCGMSAVPKKTSR